MATWYGETSVKKGTKLIRGLGLVRVIKVKKEKT